MNRNEIENKRILTRKKLTEENLQLKKVTNQLITVEMERLRQKKERNLMHQEFIYMNQFY